MRVCSIEGCGKRHVARSYCSCHLARLVRNGDPLKLRRPFVIYRLTAEERQYSRKEQYKIWAAAAKEHLRKTQNARYAANPEKKRIAARVYRAKHEESIRQKGRERYLDDPVRRAKMTSRSTEWRAANPERFQFSNKKYKQDNKERILAASRLARYGVSAEEFAEMHAAQGMACAGCGTTTPTTKRKWCVDHDHSTGRFRGVLCQHCNTVLGHARDRPEVLRQLADYLDRSRIDNSERPLSPRLALSVA